MSDQVDLFFLEFRRLPHNKPDERGNIQLPDGNFSVAVMGGPRTVLLELEYKDKFLVDCRNLAQPRLDSGDIQRCRDFLDTEAYKAWVFNPDPDSPVTLQAMDCF